MLKKLCLRMLIMILLLPLLTGCPSAAQNKSTPLNIALSTNGHGDTASKTGVTGNTLPVQSVTPNPEPASEVPADRPTEKITTPDIDPVRPDSGGQPAAGVPDANNTTQPAGTAANDSSKHKAVYLTFDDGPNTDFTPQVLAILGRENVRASFMVIGKNAEINGELIKQMITQEHAVINHSYSHDYKIIYSSPDSLIADLDKNSNLLKALTGTSTGIFRAPGGPAHLTEPYRKKLQEKGYKSISWNITGGDSDPAGATTEQIYNNVATGLANAEKAHLTPIVLLHDGTQLSTTSAKPGSALDHYIKTRESVVAALPDIIKLFRDNGYAFATVDENTPPAW
jgi:peptidoglycan/xylan/chitin deacetylase (PgdA/CDA1 family)